MFKHYFTSDSSLSQKYKIKININWLKFDLISSDWVFSSKKLDFWTKLMIQNIPSLEWKKVLDLWCGYGIVGIYIAKKFPSCKIRAIDISDDAIFLTKQNISNLNIKNIEVVKSDFINFIDWEFFDIILTNPPFSMGKKVCFQFIEESYKKLNIWWELCVVVPTKKWAKSYKNKIYEIFQNIQTVAMERWFRVFFAKKQ